MPYKFNLYTYLQNCKRFCSIISFNLKFEDNYMVKRLFKISCLVLISLSIFGQKIPPANWSHSIVNPETKVGGEIEVIFKTAIPEGYHIYSNDYGDCPPVKALFVFKKNNTYETVGIAKAIGSHHYKDDIFGCEVADFEKKAEFRQKIKVLKSEPVIGGVLEYQMCTDDGKCVLFEYDFVVAGLNVKAGKKTNEIKEAKEGIKVSKLSKKNNVTTSEKVNKGQTEPLNSEIENESLYTDNCSSCDSILLNQLNKLTQTKASGGATKYGNIVKVEDVDYSTYKANSQGDTTSCVEKSFDGEEEEESQSFWGLFLVAFLSGLAALLTPCVFPMIPMTVSFFMKDGNKAKAIRNGVIYGLSIIAIYVLIGTLVAVIAGPAAANWLSTHWLPNVFFFLVFVVFAASFFGAFEITLPSWLVNKADQQADKGGLTGIFFMAFTIVLVSFSLYWANCRKYFG